MQKGDVLLVQGAPGTGKTHTISGIVSALLSISTDAKVLVVAHADTPVNELVDRMVSFGITDLIRVGGLTS
jgi:KaiC/GvpD/RAD55 family RecA-like ATPase